MLHNIVNIPVLSTVLLLWSSQHRGYGTSMCDAMGKYTVIATNPWGTLENPYKFTFNAYNSHIIYLYIHACTIA